MSSDGMGGVRYRWWGGIEGVRWGEKEGVGWCGCTLRGSLSHPINCGRSFSSSSNPFVPHFMLIA